MVDEQGERSGLRMIEPYRPGRLPVVFVHGLASDKFTWLDLVNDLRSTPGFSEHFQIWAFQYSTGQPFLRSGYELRQCLQGARQHLDPEGVDPALSNFMLIGHSMGGLVSKLQITSSESRIWDRYFNQPFDTMQIPEERKDFVRDSLFFEPLPLVKRVVFIGTPHRGSSLAHHLAGKLGSLLIRTPAERTRVLEEIKKLNPDSSFDKSLARGLPTSIELLRQDSPLLMAMYDLPVSPSVQLHNIIGTARTRWDGTLSDGVVPITSARHPGTVSQLEVDATHTELTRHPETVDELRRLLELHLRTHQQNLVLKKKNANVRPY